MSNTKTSDEGPVYFWREYDETYAFLSQWYLAPFTAPSPAPNGTQMTFVTTEQYMMYHKGLLFRDIETAEKIMIAKTPKKQKALGREVKGFNEKLWNQHREKIVEEGNWHKFCHPVVESNLKKSLLETGERELVEVREFEMITSHELGLI